MSYSLLSRAASSSSSPPGLPEFIPARQETTREGTGGSYLEAQKNFMEMVGLLEAKYSFDEEVLCEEEATILASALDHQYYEDVYGRDKYFTSEEHDKLSQHVSGVCRMFVDSCKEVMASREGGLPRAEVVRLLEAHSQMPLDCQCPAHVAFRTNEKPELRGYLGDLITIPPSLTDHWGNELACGLLPILLKKGGLNMSVKSCSIGSPYTVNFILQMSSGRSYHFVGHPDFTVNEKQTSCILRFTIRAVGETQSPPGRSKESKTAALCQAGIYTVGQFGYNTGNSSETSLAAVVLHKDKTAQVAMATVYPEHKRSENSIGEVTFKLVERIEPLDLKNPQDLQVLSYLFCRAMKKARGCTD